MNGFALHRFRPVCAGHAERSAKEKMEQRKLSDILIEIAMQGLKDPGAGHSDVMHPLMWLAHVAWNREMSAPDYLKDQMDVFLAKFAIPKDVLLRNLISTDWNDILERMRAYKRVRFPDDDRYITFCAYTPHGTLRAEFTRSSDPANRLPSIRTPLWGPFKVEPNR
jgi:hypothetical protein